MSVVDATQQLQFDGTRPTDERAARVWDAAAEVPDPEIPVLGIDDLGILRGVQLDEQEPGRAVVVITPTYSGCPAMETIARLVTEKVTALGYDDVRVRTVLHPAWTTDWMTEKGKAALEEYGIAPPGERPQRGGPVMLQLSVRCPRCHSTDVRELAHFASTSCKALYQCRSCAEPFDHFKVL